MKQIALQYFSNMEVALVALCLFFGSFMILIMVVFFIEPKKKYEFLSQIPLDKEEAKDV